MLLQLRRIIGATIYLAAVLLEELLLLRLGEVLQKLLLLNQEHLLLVIRYLRPYRCLSLQVLLVREDHLRRKCLSSVLHMRCIAILTVG